MKAWYLTLKLTEESDTRTGLSWRYQSLYWKVGMRPPSSSSSMVQAVCPATRPSNC